MKAAREREIMRRVRNQPGGQRGRMPSMPADGRWIVALPAWGERCVRVLEQSTFPALLRALYEITQSVEVLVWTDRPETILHMHAALPVPGNVLLRTLAVPGPDNAFESMSNCHREAIARAAGGDRVLLLTADMVLSREVLATCEHQIASGGKQLVCCAAMRALEDGGAPVGASGRELLEWAWTNRHPMTRECTWPDGRSYDVWRMYFEQGGEVVARVFLPHPLVAVPGGRRLEFRPTIDVNLINNFSQAQTHMITSPDEGAVVELSPVGKDFLLTTTMRERMVNTQHSCPPLIRCTNQRHRMFWGRRVVIRGAGGDCGDGELVRRVLG